MDIPLPRIGQPAMRALAAISVTSIEQLTKFTEIEIAQLHGMGPKALKILRDELARNGLKFKK